VPVVRNTGGLADTVHDGKNGFVFNGKSPEQFLVALHRAVDCFADKKALQEFRLNGMRGDYSWRHSAKEYMEYYKEMSQ
jgi:starch synthase